MGIIDIRLRGRDTQELDKAEDALRRVLKVPDPHREYTRSNRRGRATTGEGPPLVDRYLQTTGTRLASSAKAPLEAAEEAKRGRDFAGEISALMGGYDAMQDEPWWPLREGDIVLMASDFSVESGITYTVKLSELGDDHARLVPISYKYDGEPDMTIMAAYMEAGPSDLTIIRRGVIVGGNPVRYTSS